MKRTVSFLLAVLMLLCVFCACGETTDPSDTTAAVNSEAPGDVTTLPEETVAENIRDVLPESASFNDDYVILTRKATSYEVMTNEVTGDIVKDAVSERNEKIGERFGVNVKVEEIPGDWGDRDSFVAHVRNSVSSGISSYDLLMTHSAYIVNFGVEGLAYNMNDLSRIDFNKKWWCAAYKKNVDINGKVYSAIGDIGYTMYAYMICVFMNKGLAAEYGVNDVYQLVKDGKWTFDKLMQYADLVYVDSNNSGKADAGDTFGYGLGSHIGRGAATFWDAQMLVRGEDGKMQVNLPNEKYTDIYNLLYDTVYNHTEHVLFKSEGADCAADFADEHLLFFSERLGLASKFKDMKSEYGVVPFPKYNEDQANYISSSRDYMSAIAIPSNIDNAEMVGTITEAMCMYGYTTVTPQYYELTLKFKYMSDPDAVLMLDTVRDTLTHDFAMTYTNYLDLVYAKLGDSLNNKTKDITATARAISKTIPKKLNDLYAAYEK